MFIGLPGLRRDGARGGRKRAVPESATEPSAVVSESASARRSIFRTLPLNVQSYSSPARFPAACNEKFAARLVDWASMSACPLPTIAFNVMPVYSRPIYVACVRSIFAFASVFGEKGSMPTPVRVTAAVMSRAPAWGNMLWMGNDLRLSSTL